MQLKLGFSLGQIAYEKETGHSPASKLFFITSIGDQVSLGQVCPYVGEPMILQLGMPTFLGKWTIYKLDAPVKMSGGQQLRPRSLRIDVLKGTLMAAVLSADVQNKASLEGLQFFRKPDEVRAKALIKEGQLVLAPVANMLYFLVKYVPGAVKLGKHDISEEDETFEEMVDVYILPVPKPPILAEQLTTFKDDTIVAAYWWIGTTDIKSNANMSITVVEKKQVQIPCFTNTLEIQPGDKLLKYKAKAAAPVPLSSATVISGDKASVRPKKKGKVSK